VKAESSVLGESSVTSDAVTSVKHTVTAEAASTETGHFDEVEAVTASHPSDCQPVRLTATAEAESSLQLRTDDGCVVYTASVCSAITSSLPAAATDVVDTDGNVTNETSGVVAAADATLSAADAVEVTTSSSGSICSGAVADVDVATSHGDASTSTTNIASGRTETSDATVTSHVNLGRILAESFVTGTHTAATVVSTQATVGFPLAAGEVTSPSSDLRSSSAPGICSTLLFSSVNYVY